MCVCLQLLPEGYNRQAIAADQEQTRPSLVAAHGARAGPLPEHFECKVARTAGVVQASQLEGLRHRLTTSLVMRTDACNGGSQLCNCLHLKAPHLARRRRPTIHGEVQPGQRMPWES